MEGIRAIDRLGAAIEEAWRAANYDKARFPQIATEALVAARLPDEVRPDDLIGWALRSPSLPHQRDMASKFGQPPLTLFRAPRFYIDALHWIDGSTTVHQHGFSGAFQVLAGSSIETRYAFERRRSFDGHFVLGDLHVVGTCFHSAGDATPIEAGPRGLTHALFHLDRPSISIVVRTFHDGDAGPQFNYYKPGIGVDPFFVEDSRDRALQVVNFLCTVAHPDLERFVGDYIARSDLHTAYRVLEVCLNIADRGLFERLVGRVRDDSAIDAFRASFEERRRLAFLYSRRALVKDAELRCLLGILLIAPGRKEALAFVRQRMPDVDPAQQTARWLRALSQVNVKLQAAGLPWQPNLLGLPEFDDRLEQAVAAVLAGEEKPTDPTQATALSQLKTLPALAALFN
jgi:hypothetical protein